MDFVEARGGIICAVVIFPNAFAMEKCRLGLRVLLGLRRYLINVQINQAIEKKICILVRRLKGICLI